MQTRIISSLAAAALVLSACGGGGDGGGGSASGDQAKAADMIVTSMEAEGIDVDSGCIDKLATQLSDEDAKKIVEAGTDGEPELSAEGEALGDEIFGCVDMSSLVDQMMETIGDQPGVDKDCLREVLEGLTAEQLQSSEMPDSLFECIDIGG